MKSPLRFDLLKKSPHSEARLGRVHTDHGVVETPIFMPVGTAGTVKSLNSQQIQDTHAQIILGNTYHLYLRPGTEILQKAGGLHKFMNWNGPILTDSGGFQVWSLQSIRKISDEGVEFRSHLDGSKHMFSPEKVMEIQRAIGADIIMAFDECTPYPATEKEVLHSLGYTQRWTERAKIWLENNPPIYDHGQALFGIVQGGMYKEFREQALDHLIGLDLPGYALGGLSVGEPTELMYEIAEHIAPKMPENKPRYVMGVGTPANLLELIERGVDMFDCVMPSRNARNGQVFTSKGVMNYKAAKFAHLTDEPLDENCDCHTCKNYSKAYLRHLFHAQELLALQLATIHNIHFYLDLMKQARFHLRENTFEIWKKTKVIEVSQRL
jgi:queuine tRNA-ribosyltransferase